MIDRVFNVLFLCTGNSARSVLAEAYFHIRTAPAQWLADAVATFGLLQVVLGRRRAEDAPWMVACWIGAAYWFAASTSFANPAITIARSLTNTFSGIRPIDVPAFILAQLAGALVAWVLARFIFATAKLSPAARNSAAANTDPLESEAARG